MSVRARGVVLFPHVSTLPMLPLHSATVTNRERFPRATDRCAPTQSSLPRAASRHRAARSRQRGSGPRSRVDLGRAVRDGTGNRACTHRCGPCSECVEGRYSPRPIATDGARTLNSEVSRDAACLSRLLLGVRTHGSLRAHRDCAGREWVERRECVEYVDRAGAGLHRAVSGR